MIALILKMTEGAIGPVSIRIFTVNGTAVGMLRNITRSVYVTDSITLIYHKHHRSNCNIIHVQQKEMTLLLSMIQLHLVWMTQRWRCSYSFWTIQLSRK